jgi:hypothetical protein
MIYDADHKKLWYATYNQMCYYDIPSSVGSCLSNWYYPSYTYGPTTSLNKNHPNLIYVMSNYGPYWRFDINKAVQNLNPWATGPNQNVARYDYPCSAFWTGLDGQDWVYMIGGSYSTSANERINVTLESMGEDWQNWGSIPSRTYGSGCQTFDRLVYIISGEFDYSYSSQVMVYDMKTGKSKQTSVYINQGRLWMGTAIAPLSAGSVIYVLNGYAYYYYYSTVNSIEYSNAMTMPTPSPTQPPTRIPTKAPTRPPTRHPTRSPSKPPTRRPSKAPTRRPSKAPTHKPTRPPTKKPSTRTPSRKPTKSPTPAPTKNPSRHPSRHPSGHPSRSPTSRPTPKVETFFLKFEFWLKSWEINIDDFKEDPNKKNYVKAAAHDALVEAIRHDVHDLPEYWPDLFTLEQLSMADATDTKEDTNPQKITKFEFNLYAGVTQIRTLLLGVFQTPRKIKSASAKASDYLEKDFDDVSMDAYYSYDGLSGEKKDTNAPTPAPASTEAITLAQDKSVMGQAWFWIVIVVAVLVLFFGAMALYMRHTSKKDKLRRQQNMMAIQKLASLSGGVPMSPLQQQQQQALTHALWLGVGGGGTGGTNTNSNGEQGENEGGGQHTQLLNDMLASKLKAQQANQASLAMGGGSSGMGMGMAPMGMGGMNQMGGGMGMGGMGMPQQLYNANSIGGDLNNYMFNPAMMNMGMNWQEMAQMVAWQNQMLMAQANGKVLNPALLSTDALNLGGEDALSGGENDDPNRSNKLMDQMNLNTSNDGENVEEFEE